MFACEEGLEDFVLMLLQHGADQMATNSEGQTSEDLARKSDQVECLKVMKTFRTKRESFRRNREEEEDAISGPFADPQLYGSESDESSRASQVDPNADFGDDLDSWNDEISDISLKKVVSLPITILVLNFLVY